MHLKMLEMLGPEVCMTVALGVDLTLGLWFIFFCVTSKESVLGFFSRQMHGNLLCFDCAYV